MISTLLSKNASLRQIDISLPFHVNQLTSCISIIQSGLDQNLTLERLTVNKKIMFKRNEHTAKFEVVQDHELYASQSNQAITGKAQDDRNLPVILQCMGMPSVLPQLRSANIHHQIQCKVSSYSPYMDDKNSLQASPTKWVKVESSSSDRVPPTANHTGCFIPVSDQHQSITAPPIYYPSTLTDFTTSIDYCSNPFPTTSTSQ